MEKDVLINYFIYYLKKGKDREQLEQESLAKKYPLKDIEDSMEIAIARVAPGIKKKVPLPVAEQRKSTNRKIWITLVVIIILLVIILAAVYFLGYQTAFVVQEGIINCGSISDTLLEDRKSVV